MLSGPQAAQLLLSLRLKNKTKKGQTLGKMSSKDPLPRLETVVEDLFGRGQSHVLVDWGRQISTQGFD